MQLMPYLYAAFVRYHIQGVPPVRALVMDYPDDVKAWTADDEYMFGGDLLVAPVFARQKERLVYLPEGEWLDFWSGATVAGAQTPPIERIPVFVKSGTLLPLAKPTIHTASPNAYALTVRSYGSPERPTILYEDDGSLQAAFTEVMIEWDAQKPAGNLRRSGPAQKQSYTVTKWEQMG
jgi:alpha-D-xyloside xylohydrolase